MLEEMLRKHAGVADAAVVGVPDEEAGELPRAYVVASSPDITEQELADFVNSKVNTYYQLRGGVHIIEAIPKNASGKTMRRNLRERAVRELEQASSAEPAA